MKKLSCVLTAAIILLTGISIQAQTLEEILAKHFETIGQDKLIKVQSLVTKGKLIQGSMEIPITGYQKRPDKTRMEGTFQGMTFTSGYDGKDGWHLNPFAGDTLPRPATDEENDQLKEQADIDGMLYNYKEKGYKLELAGTDTMEGQKVYLLKLTKPNGNVYTHYMDAENYVILKTVSKVKVKDVEREVETYYSDYKPVEGIIFPFSTESKMGGNTVAQFVFDSISLNEEIPDSIFEMSSAKKQ